MTRRAWGPADIALVAALALGAVAALPGGGSPAAVEVVSPGGAALWPLGTGRREVAGPLGVTVVEVGPRGGRVVASPCAGQVCVRAGEVTRPGQVVACLPNRVAVRLVGGASGEGVDAVAR